MPDRPMPDAILASPEKHEPARAIDDARIERCLDSLAGALVVAIATDGPEDCILDGLLAMHERGSWRDDQRFERLVPLNPDQKRRVKVLAIAAVLARGGRYRVGPIDWRSDGGDLWTELPT